MPNYSGIWTEQAMMQAVAAGTWAGVPGAPTIGTATVLGATSVSVAFTAPAFAGLPAAITGYTVTSSPGGITATGATSPITVTGLTEGTPYTFTVTATNASGTSSPSAASNSVTPVQINYIEEMFSTYLYTGNSSTQTITNGIDLAGEGGLVWCKFRNDSVQHALYDTARGVQKELNSASTSAQITRTNGLTSFSSTGFVLGSDSVVNQGSAPNNYASWTFRKQPKFFDVVTYTGDSVSGREISHNLGSTPGCIIVKCTTNVTAWRVYHRSLVSTGTGVSAYLRLDSTAAVDQQTRCWGFTGQPTATTFGVGNDGDLNETGRTYVAYLFAHDAGGFGLTGTDNVISCGSYTGTGTDQSISLGFEPQWVMIKKSSGISDWAMFDNMRGAPVLGVADSFLKANGSNAEYNAEDWVEFYAEGFKVDSAQSSINGSGDTMIYIAIRRGPMKVPTDGTKVYKAEIGNSSSAPEFNAGFPVDMALMKDASGVEDWYNSSRLLQGKYLVPNSTAAEGSSTNFNFAYQNGWYASATTRTSWMFQRSPGFMDVCCYTGNDGVQNVVHSLGVAPGLLIIKARPNAGNWFTWHNALANTEILRINLADAKSTSTGMWNSTTPTATQFTVGASAGNSSTNTYVAYLFATCPGVSKVGSYTGTGALQTINCGFAAGSRFVLIKRTDSTGDWYTYDSARGLSSSSDPYLFLNSTAAEVTGTNYVDTTSVGFQVTAAAPAGLNASGGTYIFLAIA